MRTRRPIRLVALTAVAALSLVAAAPSGAQTSDDPVAAADAGATWLVSWVGPEGYLANPDGTPDISSTRDIAVALALTGTHEETFDLIMGWMSDNVEDVITPDGFDSPGSLGYLIMLTTASGGDPSNFGGVDLVSRLAGTLGDFEAGLYGEGDPTFDGVFRQSLAILGLVAAGQTPPTAAVDWLADQQCDGATPAAEGGWEPYRANPGDPCAAPDPTTFTGPDTNSTAMATQAFVALGQSPGSDPLAYLASAQTDDGGFSYLPGSDVDPNSTALVIGAIVASGQDPASGSWDDGGANPYTSLLSWQLDCDSPDAGAFASPFSDGDPDMFASRQAVWGLSGGAFPIAAIEFGPAADPCSPEEPLEPLDPADDETAAEDLSAPGTDGTGPGTVPAEPIGAAPQFTG